MADAAICDRCDQPCRRQRVSFYDHATGSSIKLEVSGPLDEDYRHLDACDSCIEEFVTFWGVRGSLSISPADFDRGLKEMVDDDEADEEEPVGEADDSSEDDS